MPKNRTQPITTHPVLASIRIMRPWNLAMIAASMALFSWRLTGQVAGEHVWAVGAMVALAAAGNVINDYFDQREDRINKPERALVGRVVKRRVVLAEHLVWTVVALGLAARGSWQLASLWPLVWVALLGGALTAYSPWFKRQFLRGNVLIALAVGQLPLWTGAALGVTTGPGWRVLVGFAVLSGILTFIREVTKDVQDAEGDAHWGYDTLAVRWGREKTMRLLGLLSLFSTGLLVCCTVWWWGQIGLQAWWCSAFLLPALVATRHVMHGNVHRASAWQKLTLAGGLMALAVAPPLM